jgi:hypothetical protein
VGKKLALDLQKFHLLLFSANSHPYATIICKNFILHTGKILFAARALLFLNYNKIPCILYPIVLIFHYSLALNVIAHTFKHKKRKKEEKFHCEIFMYTQKAATARILSHIVSQGHEKKKDLRKLNEAIKGTPPL